LDETGDEKNYLIFNEEEKSFSEIRPILIQLIRDAKQHIQAKIRKIPQTKQTEKGDNGKSKTDESSNDKIIEISDVKLSKINPNETEINKIVRNSNESENINEDNTGKNENIAKQKKRK